MALTPPVPSEKREGFRYRWSLASVGTKKTRDLKQGALADRSAQGKFEGMNSVSKGLGEGVGIFHQRSVLLGKSLVLLAYMQCEPLGFRRWVIQWHSFPLLFSLA